MEITEQWPYTTYTMNVSEVLDEKMYEPFEKRGKKLLNLDEIVSFSYDKQTGEFVVKGVKN